MTGTRALVPFGQSLPGNQTAKIPAIVQDAGAAAEFAWDEFFRGLIANDYTRQTYMRAVRQFLDWSESQSIPLKKITPGMVGEYLRSRRLATPSKKVHLAAIRAFFDLLVQRHAMALNPAHSVRTERLQIEEGRTPQITFDEAMALLHSIKLETIRDFRDRAVIAMLLFTAARAGAIAKLTLDDLTHDGSQFVLAFHEKRGKLRTIPVRSELDKYLLEYLTVAGLKEGTGETPFFRTLSRNGTVLLGARMTAVDICRMVKRRLTAARLNEKISPHSFRSCAATTLLQKNVPLADVQYLLGHADARTTRLYDRRQKQVTRNIVEQISV